MPRLQDQHRAAPSTKPWGGASAFCLLPPPQPALGSVSPHPRAQQRVGTSRTPADKDGCKRPNAQSRPKLLQTPSRASRLLSQRGTFLPSLGLRSGAAWCSGALQGGPGVPPATSQRPLPPAGRGGRGAQPEGLSGRGRGGCWGREREDPETWRPLPVCILLPPVSKFHPGPEGGYRQQQASSSRGAEQVGGRSKRVSPPPHLPPLPADSGNAKAGRAGVTGGTSPRLCITSTVPPSLIRYNFKFSLEGELCKKSFKHPQAKSPP